MERTRTAKLIVTSILIHLPIPLGALLQPFLGWPLVVPLMVWAMIGGFVSLLLMLCARCNRWVYDAENGWAVAGYRFSKNPISYFWPRERCLHCGHQFDPR